MPTIELDGSPDDIVWVQSVMIFPADQAARDRHFAVWRAYGELQDANETDLLPLDAARLRLLVDAPSLSELKAQTGEATRRAIVAGNILCTLFLMHTFKLKEPSMNKAIFVAQEYAQREGVMYGDGSKLHKSEAMIRKYWNEFRPVAHLWAAMNINQIYSFADGDRNVFAREVFPKFLEVAATILEFGMTFVPVRARDPVPILDPAHCWTLPESIRPIRLTPARPPNILIKTLKKYSAT